MPRLRFGLEISEEAALKLRREQEEQERLRREQEARLQRQREEEEIQRRVLETQKSTLSIRLKFRGFPQVLKFLRVFDRSRFSLFSLPNNTLHS